MPKIYLGLILISIINLLVALFIWLRNPKDKINIFFALGIVGLALWGAGEALMFIAKTSDLIAWFGRLTYFFGIFTSFNFYFFSVYFPYQHYRLKSNLVFLFTLLFLIITLISFMPGALIKEGVVGMNGLHNDLILNPLGFWFYALFFFVAFGLSFYNLFSKYYRSAGFSRIQLKYTTFGTLIVFVFGTIFDLLIPYFKGEVVGWVGPYVTLVMLFVIAYIVFFAGNEIRIKFR